jgi:ornithine lipid ester-linked acyl 2-hydroxylase
MVETTRTSATGRAAKAARGGVEAWLGRSSLVPVEPFLDPGLFAWVQPLEAHWGDIRTELDALLADGDPGCPAISDQGWETIFLTYYGMRELPRSALRCPRTMLVLAGLPGLRSASFSILYPGATIAPHRGPYRGVLRYHLGLRIPAPLDSCGIRVGGELRHWREGESLVFDEAYTHEAWNHGDGVRVVLFLDIVRPLRQPARAANDVALKAFAWLPAIRAAKQRHLAWERQHPA